MKRTMEFTHIVLSGNLEIAAPCNDEEIMRDVAGIMDNACTWDILSNPVMIGADGRVYTISIEAVLSEAAQDFAIESLESAIADLTAENDDAEFLRVLKMANSPEKLSKLVELYKRITSQEKQ